MWSLRGYAKHKANSITFAELFTHNMVTSPNMKKLQIKRETQTALNEIKKEQTTAEAKLIRASDSTRQVLAEVRAEGRKRARAEPPGPPAAMQIVAPNAFVPPSDVSSSMFGQPARERMFVPPSLE